MLNNDQITERGNLEHTKYTARADKIGQRIKQCRIEAGLTQIELLEKVRASATSTPTLRAWEKGKRLPDIQTLLYMCIIFDCDIGYLLCDYDTKRWQAADIQQYTGLSEAAISRLHDRLQKTREVHYSNGDTHHTKKQPYLTLNHIIEAPQFIELLRALHNLKYYSSVHLRGKLKVSDVMKDKDCWEFFYQQVINIFRRIIDKQFSLENIKIMQREHPDTVTKDDWFTNEQELDYLLNEVD